MRLVVANLLFSPPMSQIDFFPRIKVVIIMAEHILDPDPTYWPIIAAIYRYSYEYGTIYTTCRYEEVHREYRLVRKESDIFCSYCGTSVAGGYGVVMFLRPSVHTIPIFACIGCIGEHNRYNGLATAYLTWESPAVDVLIERLMSSGVTPDNIIDSLHEIGTSVQFNSLRCGCGLSDMSPQFDKLMRGARKL